jgi:hypothetical protein
LTKSPNGYFGIITKKKKKKKKKEFSLDLLIDFCHGHGHDHYNPPGFLNGYDHRYYDVHYHFHHPHANVTHPDDISEWNHAFLNRPNGS